MKTIVLVLLGLYALSGVGLYFFQEKFIFLDEALPQDFHFEFGVPCQDVFLTTTDGARLHGLHFTHDAPKGLVLYYHGNAKSLKRWGKEVQPLRALGYDVLVMDYRGYGKSTGQRSQKKLLADALQWYDYAQGHYPEEDITVYGRSLGTGMACYVAGQNQPRQLLLETPYYSFQSVVQRYYPIFPVGWVLRYRFPSHKYIQAVQCPITIFHGTEDAVVPYSQGEQLANARTNAHLITIEGGEHNDLGQYATFQEALTQILP